MRAPQSLALQRWLVADQPEQPASGKKDEKHHEQELDEYRGKAG